MKVDLVLPKKHVFAFLNDLIRNKVMLLLLVHKTRDTVQVYEISLTKENVKGNDNMSLEEASVIRCTFFKVHTLDHPI